MVLVRLLGGGARLPGRLQVSAGEPQPQTAETANSGTDPPGAEHSLRETVVTFEDLNSSAPRSPGTPAGFQCPGAACHSAGTNQDMINEFDRFAALHQLKAGPTPPLFLVFCLLPRDQPE